MKKFIGWGLVHALLAGGYIFSVVWVMSHGEKSFGPVPEVLIGFAMLSLFVLSAAVMGILIFGKPILLFIDKKRKEAAYLLGATVGWLLVIVVCAFVVLMLIRFYNPAPVAPDTTGGTANNLPTTTIGNAGCNDLRNVNLSVNQPITSPFQITGEAKGNWFFEASFPVTLVNWDGLIIAQGIAQAKSDWMTTDFVPFAVELKFNKPDYKNNGAVILKKDNPSGLPQNDASCEVSILFK